MSRVDVVDLAKGHLAALKKVDSNPGCVTYNLGTGTGYSVLEMLAAYSKAAGKELKHVMADRRPGDVAVCYGAPAKAKAELGLDIGTDLSASGSLATNNITR